MPDGTYQVADRYIPQVGEPCPTLLVRTPYGRGFPYDFMYGGLFAEQGYCVLLQSTRGTGGSGGICEPFTDEAADAHATIAWLPNSRWFNGSLATIGASYLGFTQWALANDPPPELKAMVVQVSADDFYGFIYPGGAFAISPRSPGVAAMLSQDKGFRAFMGAVLRLMLTYRKVERTVPLVPGTSWRSGSGSDTSRTRWRTRPPATRTGAAACRSGLESAPPVHLLGGWYDVVIDETLDSYRRLREVGRTVQLSSGRGATVRVQQGHADHCRGGARVATSTPDRERGNSGPTTVRVHVGEIGGKGQWRDLADWPPPDAVVQPWHLNADGTLTDAPGEGASSSATTPPIRRPR